MLANESTLNNGLARTTVTYTDANSNVKNVDAGIRYVGGIDEVNNRVYYNCDDKDIKNVKYGSSDYNYESSCEIWKIIGVFDVKDKNGNIEKRIKIINTDSTFSAARDGSNQPGSTYASNQMGPSSIVGGTELYAGSDLMQLLNGYYIGANASCGYNNSIVGSGFAQTCDTENDKLKDKNMKPLTTLAKEMIKEADWYTYATIGDEVNESYLQERGITTKYTGCKDTETKECTDDKVIRNNEWIGLVGLMYKSDLKFTGGWIIDNQFWRWTITPQASSYNSFRVIRSQPSGLYSAGTITYDNYVANPTVYLKPDVNIIGGDGNLNPYKLSV